MTLAEVQGDTGIRVTFPEGPKGYPLLGVLPTLKRDPLKYFVDVALKYGEIVPLDLGPHRVLMINNPEYIKRVFQDNFENYRKSDFHKVLRPILGAGIFMVDGDEWLQQRRTALPGFQGTRFASMANAISQATGDMCERWQSNVRSGEPIDVCREMMKVTVDIILQTMFSSKADEDAAKIYDVLAVVLRQAEKRVWSLLPLPVSIPTPNNIEFRKALAALDAVVARIVEGRRSDPGAHDDLLAALMEAYDSPGPQGKNPTLLRDQVMSILLAGHETTANALAWTWYLLSKNPGVERRARDEVSETLEGRVPTLEDLSKLTYTTQVFKEAMRLYPPVWSLSRTALEDDRYGDLKIPAGTTVVLCPYAMHRHPKYWENPEGFDPDRFAEGYEERIPRYAYFPFGGGPRICMGMRFAFMEAQIIMAMILQRYRLHLVPGCSVEPEPMITLRPRGKVPMTVENYVPTVH